MLALGQIMTRMNTEGGYYYGVAVPRSYEALVYGRVPWQVCKRLQLRLLVVDSSGSVDELTWRSIRRGPPKVAQPTPTPRISTKRGKKESGWDIMKRQMPDSRSVAERLVLAKRAGRSQNYLRSLEALKRYWEKRRR